MAANVRRAALVLAAFLLPLRAGAQETQAATAGTQGGPAWTILPSLGVDEAFTDNVDMVAKGRQSDAGTTLLPSLYVNGDTPRLTASFGYTPQFILHSRATDDDEVTQNLLGNGTLTAVNDLLFVDGAASVETLDRSGGLGFGNQAEIPESQQTQTTVYSLSPYMRFHFGDTGDSELRYQIAQSLFAGDTGAVASTTTGTTLGPLANAVDQAGSASFTSGENFARLQFGAQAAASQENASDGSRSRDDTATVSGEYAITDALAGTGQVGYERLAFTPTTTGNFSGPTWQIGAHYQPRPDRSATIDYGKAQGETGVTGNLDYELTPLITVTAALSQSTATQQSQLLTSLSGLAVAAPGSTSLANGVPVSATSAGQQTAASTVSATTGTPASLENPNLALQNGVTRTRTMEIAVAMQGGERDHYSLDLNRTTSESLSVGTTSQRTTGGLLTWSRDVSPAVSSTMSAGYAVTDSSATAAATLGTRLKSLTGNAGLNYAMSDTLTASADYSLSRQQGGTTGTVLVDIVVFSLRKQF